MREREMRERDERERERERGGGEGRVLRVLNLKYVSNQLNISYS